MKNKLVKTTYTGKRGITDISLGDFATEWWTDADWSKWRDKQPERDAYVAKLKEEGRYGEEYQIDIYLNPNPLFDDVSAPNIESYRMVFLDLNEENENN